MNPKLSIEVTPEDQVYVEDVCTKSGYTFGTFFSHLLLLYKRSLTEPMHAQEEVKEKKTKAKNNGT